MAAETTIIIRTKNEERWIGCVLEKLFSQTYKNFEIVIVDSGSTDATLKIAKRFLVKILEIPPASFSYPYALNYGIDRSNAEKFVVILSAHSLPISGTWLADGIENFSLYENVAGVYGFLRSLPGISIWDKVFMDPFYVFGKLFKRRVVVTKPGMGVLGFTNAIIRKDLWDKRHFNEAYGLGGEDGEWAAYWLGRGFVVIRDARFSVRHSHNLGLSGWIKQWQHWRSLALPQPFHPLSFRKDRAHH